MLERLKTKTSKVFCFVFFAGFKISNFNVWTAKHLIKASWTELVLIILPSVVYVRTSWQVLASTRRKVSSLQQAKSQVPLRETSTEVTFPPNSRSPMGSVPERMSQKRIFLSYKEKYQLFLVNVIGGYTVVHPTNRVGTKSTWPGATPMRCMSKDFLGFIQSVTKGIIHGNWWFVYKHEFYTKKTQN